MLKELLNCYKVAFKTRFEDFLNLSPELVEERDSDEQIDFEGVVSLVGITGEKKGRVIFYLSEEFLKMLYRLIYGEEESLNEMELYAVAAEINNIISGNAITLFNNESSKRLFLSPPSIFSGKLSITTPRINSKDLIYKIGNLKIAVSIGLEGGI